MNDEINNNEEENDQEEVQEAIEGCNCEDEFVTTPCPIHSPPNPEEAEPKFGEKGVLIITDAHLSEEGYGTFEGFKFICPDCQVPSIMVNADMGIVCCKCGKKVIVKSKTVTNFIRGLENVNKKGNNK